MIGGTLAQLIAPGQPPSQSLPILVAGVGFQGLGWMVALLMYAAYIHRLMQYGLPPPNLRPGMFISVGPPAFTGLALIGIANALPEDYGYFATNPAAVQTLQGVATFVAIFLWILAFWFFSITVLAVLMGLRKMSFHLVWWSFVFPNVGFNIATIKIGEQLESEGILWVSSVMTILLVAMWIFVILAQARAVWKRDIMMPGKDEDHGESQPYNIASVWKR
jgi:tellurite resistance protein TehA-like permease